MGFFELFPIAVLFGLALAITYYWIEGGFNFLGLLIIVFPFWIIAVIVLHNHYDIKNFIERLKNQEKKVIQNEKN